MLRNFTIELINHLVFTINFRLPFSISFRNFRIFSLNRLFVSQFSLITFLNFRIFSFYLSLTLNISLTHRFIICLRSCNFLIFFCFFNLIHFSSFLVFSFYLFNSFCISVIRSFVGIHLHFFSRFGYVGIWKLSFNLSFRLIHCLIGLSCLLASLIMCIFQGLIFRFNLRILLFGFFNCFCMVIFFFYIIFCCFFNSCFLFCLIRCNFSLCLLRFS